MDLTTRTFINGREIPRARVLEWEKRRARIVLKKLAEKPSSNELGTMREQLLERKEALGAKQLLAMLHRQLVASEAMAVLTARLSGPARRYSITEITASTGTAEQFVDWFNERARLNDERAMLAATPDHYVIRTNEKGIQDVVETTGGSPLPARFFIDYDDLSGLRSKADPTYPLQVAGVAHSSRGVVLGGVRHQFRNEGTGFRTRLLVEFPWLTPPSMISGHQWHLASEFGHWIEAAIKGSA